MIDGTGASIVEIMTAEQLEHVRLPGKSTELVRGRLVMREPPGTYHGRIAGRLLTRVGPFVEAHDLGEVFGQDTGFRIASDPDTVRAPDLAAGVRLVWVIDPDRKSAYVFPSDGSVTTIAAGGDLDGENVLPGFSCRLTELFE